MSLVLIFWCFKKRCNEYSVGMFLAKMPNNKAFCRILKTKSVNVRRQNWKNSLLAGGNKLISGHFLKLVATFLKVTGNLFKT